MVDDGVVFAQASKDRVGNFLSHGSKFREGFLVNVLPGNGKKT